LIEVVPIWPSLSVTLRVITLSPVCSGIAEADQPCQDNVAAPLPPRSLDQATLLTPARLYAQPPSERLAVPVPDLERMPM
jgi:hypothetical protein